jgi:hypothetical protein
MTRELTTVCAACLTEACWQGTLMCDDARRAGTTQIPAPRRPQPPPQPYGGEGEEEPKGS